MPADALVEHGLPRHQVETDAVIDHGEAAAGELGGANKCAADIFAALGDGERPAFRLRLTRRVKARGSHSDVMQHDLGVRDRRAESTNRM